MRYSPYDAYERTTHSYLSEVPKNWELIKLKFLIREKITDGPHETPEFTNEGIPFLSVDGIQDGELIFDGCRTISKEDHEHYSKKCRIEQGDVLLGKAASTGKIARVKVQREFSVWSPLAVIKNDRNMLTPAYLEYSLKSELSQYQIDILCTSNTQKNISMDDIPKINLAIPPVGEQQKIAAFLDYKTQQIDRLIEKKKALIEKLEEKRIAVITQAVTKGLNKNAKLKSSGVDWLGDVPEHWDVLPIKFVCSLLKDGTHLPPARVDSGIPLLSVRNIVDGEFIFRSDDSNISEEDYIVLCKPFVPQKGDVLLAIVGATLGKVAIVKEMDRFHIQRSLAIFRVSEELITNETLAFIFQSMNFQNLLWQNVGFSAQPGIYLGVLGDFKIPVPSKKEQSVINEYCKEKVAKIEKSISLAKSVISRLNEYRSAIITSAVTGKIDVREIEIPKDVA